MKDIAVTVAAPEVVLSTGAGSMTVSVTNRTTAPERLVLTAVASGSPMTASTAQVGGRAPATTIERPLREVPGGQTEQYVVTFEGTDAVPGHYQVRFIASPSDEATEEYADRGGALVVVVPERPVAVVARKRVPWWLVAAGMALLLVIGAAVFVLTRPKSVTVPDVVGKTQAQAQDTLGAVGLGASEKAVPGVRPFGVVVSQDPAAGSSVGVSSTVAISVRVGVTVVDVEKVPIATAQAMLRAAGLTNVSVVRQPSEAPVDTVISQTPGPGAQAAPDDPVALTVASAPLVTLPNVNGREIALAMQALEALGVVPVQQNRCPTIPFAPRCVVVNEVPAPGTQVPRGSTVILVVAFG